MCMWLNLLMWCEVKRCEVKSGASMYSCVLQWFFFCLYMRKSDDVPNFCWFDAADVWLFVWLLANCNDNRHQSRYLMQLTPLILATNAIYFNEQSIKNRRCKINRLIVYVVDPLSLPFTLAVFVWLSQLSFYITHCLCVCVRSLFFYSNAGGLLNLTLICTRTIHITHYVILVMHTTQPMLFTISF